MAEPPKFSGREIDAFAEMMFEKVTNPALYDVELANDDLLRLQIKQAVVDTMLLMDGTLSIDDFLEED